MEVGDREIMIIILEGEEEAATLSLQLFHHQVKIVLAIEVVQATVAEVGTMQEMEERTAVMVKTAMDMEETVLGLI